MFSSLFMFINIDDDDDVFRALRPKFSFFLLRLLCPRCSYSCFCSYYAREFANRYVFVPLIKIPKERKGEQKVNTRPINFLNFLRNKCENASFEDLKK